MEYIEYIIKNKEWLFSGILVVVPLTIIGWLLLSRRSKTRIQKQKGGHGSTNIQVGGNIEINKKRNND